jgi:DNA-binding winged helix-turn-helix (wHTH) protein/tetratricopeptide (TPR) repeat protein
MPSATYRFGVFLLDMRSYRLFNDGTASDQPPKVLDLLALLLSRPGELVGKEQIFSALWPDVAVTDNAITQVVSAARDALGDDPAAPRFIQTVPRKGYRFIGAVEMSAADRPVSAATTVTPSAGSGVLRVAVADFVNVTADAEVAWLSVGIAETVSDDLRRLRALRVMDRAALSEAVRGADVAAARQAGIDLLITGSFQRAGTLLRMTGRAIDLHTSSAIAHAKADGSLAEVFVLQDAVVTQLVQSLHGSTSVVVPARVRTQETSSVDAYQALTEGRIKLDSLDPAAVPAAIADFTRAVDLDPNYALAYAGLGHAHFWLHQRTRLASRSEQHHLTLAIDYVQRAIGLDPDLAEAQAALAFFLANTGDPTEAIQAGRAAVALEPNEWRHHFRLGIAAWGSERLACLHAVQRLYPSFAFAHYASAMVHVARGHLDEALVTLQAGLDARPSARIGAFRFPANGLHWLTGLIKLAQHDIAGARLAFDRELAERGSELYADEYAVNAHNALGQSSLLTDQPDHAAASFREALAVAPGHARALMGLAEALRRTGHSSDADRALTQAREEIEALRTSNRPVDAYMALAQWHMVAGRPEDALVTVSSMLEQSPPGHAGWTLPVEPWLSDLRAAPSMAPILHRLALRAM